MQLINSSSFLFGMKNIVSFLQSNFVELYIYISINLDLGKIV